MGCPCFEQWFCGGMTESIGAIVGTECSVEEQDAGRKNFLLPASGGCQPTGTLRSCGFLWCRSALLYRRVNTLRSPSRIRIQNPFPIRPEPSESHAEGKAEMIGRRFGIELRFVHRQRSPLRPIHRHLSPLLSMPPRRRAGLFEFDGWFTVRFVLVEC